MLPSNPIPHLLVQFSDTHISPPGQLAYGRVDTAAHLTNAVAAIDRLPHPPLAVLVSGDLANHGSDAAYAHLRELLSPLPCPVYLMPGNHDDRAALRRAFPEHTDLQAPGSGAADGFIQYDIALPGLRLLTLDTVVPHASHGSLCTERIDWLAQRLAEAPETPTIVAMHHPPFRAFLDYMDAIGLREGSDALAAVIQQHPQVCRVLCGHLHRSVQAHWAGTVVQTAPSTAHQVWLDFSPGGANGFGMEPPGFLVHAWAPGLPLITHQMLSERFEGPYPFRKM
jgi:Icc protein